MLHSFRQHSIELSQVRNDVGGENDVSVFLPEILEDQRITVDHLKLSRDPSDHNRVSSYVTLIECLVMISQRLNSVKSPLVTDNEKVSK